MSIWRMWVQWLKMCHFSIIHFLISHCIAIYFSVMFTPIGYGEWQNWSFCSKTRGTGQKTRTRICLDGPCVGSLHENLPCRLDGSEYWSKLRVLHLSLWLLVYGDWTNWSICSCFDGQKSRNRNCLDEPCSETLDEVDGCNPGFSTVNLNNLFSRNPIVFNWQNWSSCSASCGYGTKTRYQTCHDDIGVVAIDQSDQCRLDGCELWKWRDIIWKLKYHNDSLS